MELTECTTLPGMFRLRTLTGETLDITRGELESIAQEAFDKFDICPAVWTDEVKA